MTPVDVHRSPQADNHMYAVGVKDGMMRWKFPTKSEIWSTPALTGDGEMMIFGSLDHNLYGLNTADGSLVWNYETEKGLFSSPALSELCQL